MSVCGSSAEKADRGSLNQRRTSSPAPCDVRPMDSISLSLRQDPAYRLCQIMDRDGVDDYSCVG